MFAIESIGMDAQFATGQSDTAMMAWLIQQGVDVEESDESGSSPLALAAEMGAVECIRQLLAAGADISRPGRFGRSLLASAGTPEVVEIFIEAGLDLSDLETSMRREIAGHGDIEVDFSDPMYRPFAHRTFNILHLRRKSLCHRRAQRRKSVRH